MPTVPLTKARRGHMIVRSLVALTLLPAGMLVVLDGGGTMTDVAGVLAIGAALLTLDRTIFRAVGAGVERDEHSPPPS